MSNPLRIALKNLMVKLALRADADAARIKAAALALLEANAPDAPVAEWLADVA